MRGQLRDAAQDGQQDDYGGDKLEDAVSDSLRHAEQRVEHGVERGIEQLKKLRQRHETPTSSEEVAQTPTGEETAPTTGEPAPSSTGEEPPSSTGEAVSHPTGESTPPQTGEATPREDPAAAVRQGNGTPSDTVPGEAPRATTYDHAPEASRPDRQRPSIKTKEAAQSGKPHGGEAKQPSRPTIKTKDVYLQNQQPQGEAGARSHTGRPTRKGDTGRGRRQPDTKPERGPDVPANGQNPPTRAQEMGQVQGNQTARPGGSASTQTGTKQGVTDRPPARGGARAPGQASATRPVAEPARGTARQGGEAAKRSVKTAEHSVKTTGRAARKGVKTAGHAAGQGVKTASQTTMTAQRSAQAARRSAQAARRAAQAAKAAAQAAARAAKAAAQAAAAAAKATATAIEAFVAFLVSGGWIVVLVILLIILIFLLIYSVFGLFSSGEDTGTGYTMPQVVAQINGEFSAHIEAVKTENPHDTLDLDEAGLAAVSDNWDDVLAVYAVRTAMDAGRPTDVVSLTESKIELLRQTFWDMNEVFYTLETVTREPDTEDGETTSKSVLHITAVTRSFGEMADRYGFTDDQRDMLEELMRPEYQELFQALTGSSGSLQLSTGEAKEILERLPEHLSEERKQVVLTACQLLGKVNYFWGGKSLVLGWDSRWGKPTKVWAAGSSTTGTVRPYGLDCSGYVDWVFYNVSGGTYIIGHGGGASAQHSYCKAISWSEALPGDLVFFPGDSHVGIVCGFDESGNIQIIHCSYSKNNVVVTGKSGFTTIARPYYYFCE